MENIKEQQVEALKTMIDYNKKLILALEEVVIELKGEKKEDTQKYLDYILKGVNWVIQIVNGTKDLINEKEEIVNKEEVNNIIVILNQAVKEKNDIEIANIIETGVLPFVSLITKTANEIVSFEE